MKHLKSVSDKVSKACFNFDAIAGYDQAVRDRVELEGYSQFSIIETEEVFRHFSVENTVKKIDKSSKSDPGKYKPGGATANGVCFRFNSEAGCSGKYCFIHKCSECESKSHGKKDCDRISSKMDELSNSGGGWRRQGTVSDCDELTTRARTCNSSPCQSRYKVERETGNPELNPYVNSITFDILVVEEVRGIVESLNNANTARIRP